MRFLFLSESGDGLGIGHRLTKEGHEVDFFIRDPRYDKAGVGIVSRVASWRPHIHKADLILADMVGFAKEEKVVRSLNKPFMGSSELTDQAELDRERGMRLFQAAGIPIPQTWSYDSPTAARDILKIWKGAGYVLKPSGNIKTEKTFLCRDKETFGFALSTYGAEQKLIVQEIVDGVEVSTEGWWNGRGWVEPFNHTFEEKRLLNGGLGPHTGCQGNIVIAAKKRNKLVQSTVLKLEPFLKRTSYRGPIDVNCIVNEQGVNALEVTTRFGYDAIEALMEGLRDKMADVLFETALGVRKEMDVSTDYLIATRLSVPPWPHAHPREKDAGWPVLGVEDAIKHVYLTDVYKEDGYRYAAGDGVILKATARGESVREAQRRVLRTLSNISVQGKQYRTDIGDRVEGDMAKLKAWGYL